MRAGLDAVGAARPRSATVRVLVIEDEPKLAGLMVSGLEEEGYAVDQTGSGAEAVWFATEHEYDVILLDLGLEDLDGIQVCRALRDQDVWAPIVVVTARDGVEDRVALLDLGADDYLAKPISFDELLARIRAVVRRGNPRRPSILSVGDLVLDPATKRVTRDATEIALTAKEFALLEYFLRNCDRVLERRELVEHVWDFAFEGDSRIVDVYVRYLRRKIDEPFGTDTIETVRGIGYRVRVDP
jgi:two-component system OmpR family response regulator